VSREVTALAIPADPLIRAAFAIMLGNH